MSGCTSLMIKTKTGRVSNKTDSVWKLFFEGAIKMSILKNCRSMLVGSILLLLATAGCTSAAANSEPVEVSQPERQVVLKVSGSATTTSVLAAVKPAFEADTPGYRVNTLTGSGTGGGVEGVIAGTLDVGAMGRPPTDEEASKVEYVPLGFGSEIPITHANIEIANLTSDQIAAIFSGKITNWSEIGGPDQPIIVYVRAEATDHTQTLRETIFGEILFLENAQVMGSLGDMVAAVEGTPGSVGYANWPAVVAKGAKVRAIAVDGLEAADPAYPGTIQLGISYLPERKTDVQPLIDWLLSEQGQVALRKYDVILSQ